MGLPRKLTRLPADPCAERRKCGHRGVGPAVAGLRGHTPSLAAAPSVCRLPARSARALCRYAARAAHVAPDLTSLLPQRPMMHALDRSTEACHLHLVYAGASSLPGSPLSPKAPHRKKPHASLRSPRSQSMLRLYALLMLRRHQCLEQIQGCQPIFPKADAQFLCLADAEPSPFPSPKPHLVLVQMHPPAR